MQRRIVLWDAPAALREAGAAVAKDTGVEVTGASGELSCVGWEPDVSVAVIGGCDRSSARERARAARKHFGDALLVVLLPRDELTAVHDLERLPAVTVATLGGSAEACARDLIAAATLPAPHASDGLAGVSLASWVLRARIAAAAACDASVLLLGETGAGKTAAARAIHALSDRRDGPFVTLDCAALTPSLVESELFGHERGAFTGAVASRTGRFERAGTGTVLLDEIGDIAPPLQAKFLRVLEERRFERVGGSTSHPMRARVIAATHVDLERAVREGRFRSDLYYRLRVYGLWIPPLCERPEDVLVLAARALRETAARLGRPAPELAPSFTERLLEHPWPGNVRELLHTVEAVLLQRGGACLGASSLDGLLPGAAFETARDDLPLEVSSQAAADDPEEEERERFARELLAAGGNVARTARRLGMAYSTARDRIHRLGLGDLIPRD